MSLAEPIAKSVTLDTTHALTFLHGKGIAHRDIKPCVCISTFKRLAYWCKVLSTRTFSFSLSIHWSLRLVTSAWRRYKQISWWVHKYQYVISSLVFIVKQRTIVGTPHFMAPEIRAGRGSYNLLVDSWSLGCVIFNMYVLHMLLFLLTLTAVLFPRLSGARPFEDGQNHDLRDISRLRPRYSLLPNNVTPDGAYHSYFEDNMPQYWFPLTSYSPDGHCAIVGNRAGASVGSEGFDQDSMAKTYPTALVTGRVGWVVGSILFPADILLFMFYRYSVRAVGYRTRFLSSDPETWIATIASR